MSENLPEPLVPAEVDLRDFSYMPLDVVRLRDSCLAITATGEEFRCAVLLWCVAWHQVPAASLPDDDALLSQYAGLGRDIKTWKKLRAGALHGFVKCSDGRLYHPVIAQKSMDAWTQKCERERRKSIDRSRKRDPDLARNSEGIPAEFRRNSDGTPTELHTTSLGVPGDNKVKGTEQNGTEQKGTEISLRSKRARDAGEWAAWWMAYPHKVGKAAAEKSYRAALARASPEELLAGLRRYIATKPAERAWCNPATWLNQDRWLDQPALPPRACAGDRRLPGGTPSRDNLVAIAVQQFPQIPERRIRELAREPGCLEYGPPGEFQCWKFLHGRTD